MTLLQSFSISFAIVVPIFIIFSLTKKMNTIYSNWFLLVHLKAMFYFSIILVLVQTIESVEIVERTNGYFITGRGCGVTNPIRYLNHLPKNIEEYQCSFIEFEKSRPSVKGCLF